MKKKNYAQLLEAVDDEMKLRYDNLYLQQTPDKWLLAICTVIATREYKMSDCVKIVEIWRADAMSKAEDLQQAEYIKKGYKTAIKIIRGL